MAILRDMAHAVLGALADGSVGDVLSIQRDRTAGDFFQTGQAVHQLGLTVAPQYRQGRRSHPRERQN